MTDSMTGEAGARYLEVMFAAANTGAAINSALVQRVAMRGRSTDLARLRAATARINRAALQAPMVVVARSPRRRGPRARSFSRGNHRAPAEPGRPPVEASVRLCAAPCRVARGRGGF